MRLLGDFIFLRQNPTYKKSIKNKQTTFIQISYTLRKHKKVNKQLLFIKSKKTTNKLLSRHFYEEAKK